MNPTIGDVYYKGDNAWSETYADRKVYSAKSGADAVKATTDHYQRCYICT